MTRDRKLEARWRSRLAASGFQDLEGADRDGPLSDRGNLHAIAESPEADAHLANRIESGSAYVAWTAEVLHKHRFRNALERAIWAGHANGEGLRETAKRLRITFHQARETVKAVKERAGTQGTQGKKGNAKIWRSNQLARKYRRLSYTRAIALAALLLKSDPSLKTLTQSSTRHLG